MASFDLEISPLFILTSNLINNTIINRFNLTFLESRKFQYFQIKNVLKDNSLPVLIHFQRKINTSASLTIVSHIEDL